MVARFFSLTPREDYRAISTRYNVSGYVLLSVLGAIMIITGVILAVIDELAIGIASMAIGVIIPTVYSVTRSIMVRRSCKDVPEDMATEIKFTEDAVEIVRICDAYKSKSVMKYSAVKAIEEKAVHIYIYGYEFFAIRKSCLTHGGMDELRVLLNDNLGERFITSKRRLEGSIKAVADRLDEESGRTCADGDAQAETEETISECDGGTNANLNIS